MKNVYSNLYAMRAIVCVAHERVSDEHPYNFPFSIFNFQFENNARAIMFELSQTVFTNRAQRHAAGDSPLFKSFHTLLECFNNIPCLIIGEG